MLAPHIPLAAQQCFAGADVHSAVHPVTGQGQGGAPEEGRAARRRSRPRQARQVRLRPHAARQLPQRLLVRHACDAQLPEGSTVSATSRHGMPCHSVCTGLSLQGGPPAAAEPALGGPRRPGSAHHGGARQPAAVAPTGKQRSGTLILGVVLRQRGTRRRIADGQRPSNGVIWRLSVCKNSEVHCSHQSCAAGASS